MVKKQKNLFERFKNWMFVSSRWLRRHCVSVVIYKTDAVSAPRSVVDNADAVSALSCRQRGRCVGAQL